MRKELEKKLSAKLLIKKCHVCGQVTEAPEEQQKCLSCGKSFLPLNYFTKIHDHSDAKFKELFAECHELSEDDLIKGLYVIW